MKKPLLIIFITLAFTLAKGQNTILNGSFEDGSGADLTGWEWTCNAISHNTAPPPGGNWCMKVFGGNLQGCYPGYAYQKLPSVLNGQSYLLSGWAHAETAPPVGIYFGKIKNGLITLQAGDTTSATVWTALSVQSSFSLAAGDTAVVVLYGGIATGPVQGYGYFDLIELTTLTGIDPLYENSTISISPNPFSSETTLHVNHHLSNATMAIYNCLGQTVKQIENISGKSISISSDNLPAGIYFIRLHEGNKLMASDKIIIMKN